MALPIYAHHFKKIPKELKTFTDTVYGVEDAVRVLPLYDVGIWAYSKNIPLKEGTERQALRGSWRSSHLEAMRGDVIGDSSPKHMQCNVHVFEGGKDAVRGVDARRRRFIIETTDAEESRGYTNGLTSLGIAFVTE